MRLYEATGVGAMLLTDGGSNLDDLFDPGREVAVYEGENDLIEKLTHYLAADGPVRSLMDRGQPPLAVRPASLNRSRPSRLHRSIGPGIGPRPSRARRPGLPPQALRRTFACQRARRESNPQPSDP